MSDQTGKLDPASELEALRQENAYLQRALERNTARLLSLETQGTAMRHELEQKRRGFSLMAELTVTLGQDSDYASIFLSVSRRINAALNMQRTVILVPEGEGLFRAKVMQGYTEVEKSEIGAQYIPVTQEQLDPLKPVLVTSATAKERLSLIHI